MFKFGIFRLEDYRPESTSLSGRLAWMLTRHRISLQLLRTGIPASPREITVFEALMQGLRLNSGIYRTTFHNRFRDLDPFVNELLAERFDAAAAIEVHDWAASDCLTSSEWAASLLALFPNARLTASDLTLFLVEVAWNGHALIQERDAKPLQYLSPPFLVYVNRPEQRPRMLTRILIRQAQSVVAELKSSLTIPEEWLDSESDMLSLPPYQLRKLPVVHPEAAAFRARNTRFLIMRHSAFDVLPQPADVIRSMNIYNISYFDSVQLAAGARAVWRSLRPGGLWIVGRTWQEQPPSHNVSIFEKTNSGFELVRRYGEGSEIESIVLESARISA
jgi:hypothetical protein